MNDFIMLNWYHFDLNYYIINKKRKIKNINKKKNKKEIFDRIMSEIKLKIKKD
tara:strand:- start:313 stop:471 length:159 start_codon:yes stop_codon:yes gene_type:complete